MSDENPLKDPALAELLAAERDAPDPAAQAHDRVWQRVAASVAVPLAPGDGGLSTVAAAKGSLAVKLGVSAGLVAGGGGLVVALRTEAPTEPPPSRSALPSPAQPRSEAGLELAHDAPPTGSIDHALAAERALLVEATARLRRGALPEATAALARHQSRFPQGRLAEEREALHIRVLRQGGQHDAARERLGRFAERFPHSPLLPGLRGQ